MVYGLSFFLIISVAFSGFLLIFRSNSSIESKVVVILLDGARPDIIDKLIEEGKLTHLAQLATMGVKAEFMLPVFPSISMPNYASIATGAYPGTTGITGNAVHLKGEPLDYFHSATDSQYLLAEPLWETADKAGLKSIVVSYSPSWPINLTNGIIVDTNNVETSGSRSQLFVPDPLQDTYRNSDLINITVANNWTNPPMSYSTSLETSIEVYSGPIMDALIVDTTNDGVTNYDEIIISLNKTAEGDYMQLRVGNWSSWINCTISGQPSAFKLKLLQLSSDASKIIMYKTAPYGIPDTQPNDVRFELWNATGPFAKDDWQALERGWIDEETYCELCGIASNWHLNATVHLMAQNDWQLLFTADPTIDRVEHRFMGYITPGNPYYNETTCQNYWNFIVEAYQKADQLVGAIVERAGDDAHIFVVSDHGMAAVQRTVYVNSILKSAGFLSLKSDGTIDWNATEAYYFGMGHIYVNLQGRDPNGIVTAENYENVCQAIIQALYETLDSNTNQRPIALAVMKADANALGLFGDRVGDVIFCMQPNYALGSPIVRNEWDEVVIRNTLKYRTGQHEHLLPYFTEAHSMFIAAGPKLEREVVIPPVRAIDIAPTAAYLLNIEFPPEAAGSIIINALNK